MKIIEVIRSRIIIFLSQISILLLIIYLFNYKYNLNLQQFPKPTDTTTEQIYIIEWLVNYIMYEDLRDLGFIFTIWLLISIIPIFIYNNYRKAYSMNSLTFFFCNFFFYVFIYNYYRPYFNAYFLSLFIKTIILGITIVLFSIALSFALKKILMYKHKAQIEDISSIVREGQILCPNCGTKFESIPTYCYKCNSVLKTPEDNQ